MENCCTLCDVNLAASSHVICLGGPNKYIASATDCASLLLRGVTIVKLVWSQVITERYWYPPKAIGMCLMSMERSCTGAQFTGILP